MRSGPHSVITRQECQLVEGKGELTAWDRKNGKFTVTKRGKQWGVRRVCAVVLDCWGDARDDQYGLVSVVERELAFLAQWEGD